MAEKLIQEYLFQRIKQTIPNSRILVDVVAEALYISQGSAYRRIRGETPLVLEEAQMLCRRFDISLDQLLNLTSASVVFQNVEVNAHEHGFKNFLSGILNDLKQLNSATEKKIIYFTKDFPVFFYFVFKPVFAFRYFFWMRSILQHPDFIQRKFSPDCLPADIEAIGKEILSFYTAVPSIEIWNMESINSFLLQVSNYRESGLISREDAGVVYNSLLHVVQHVQVQAEHGRKFLPGEKVQMKKDNFQLFYNRVVLADNSILLLHDEGKTLYLNYDVLNYISTKDEKFCNQVHKKFQLMMRGSTLISSGSEKQRNIFFNILTAKFPQLFIKEKTAL